MYLLEHQFSLAKIRDGNAAILFYTGFSIYEALMSLYHYIEPKLQYWKGETIVPACSHNLHHLDKFTLL